MNLEQFIINEINILNKINLYKIIDNLISLKWTNELIFVKKPLKKFNIISCLKKKNINKVLSLIIFYYDDQYINHILIILIKNMK